MSQKTDNILRLKLPLCKSLDEMSTQTLDALKLVHSFESKPARSERIKKIIEDRAAEKTERPPLRPIKFRATSSPERGAKGSLKNYTLEKDHPHECVTQQQLLPNENTLHRQALLPQPEFSYKNPDIPILSQLPTLKPKTSLIRNTTSSITKPLQARLQNRGATKTIFSPKIMPVTRTKGSSQNYSRLLQPTAASVAKINARAFPRPASRGPLTGEPATTTADKNSRPVAKPSVDHTKVFPKFSDSPAHSMAGTKNSNTIKLSPPDLSSHNHTKVDARKADPGDNRSLLTKTPAVGLLPKDVSKSPLKTSTPVRPAAAPTERDSTSHSIDYSNFSNFSYVAEWAKTPELAKRALEQQNVDTSLLFGSIPPVDIEAIFGAEIKRQQRNP